MAGTAARRENCRGGASLSGPPEAARDEDGRFALRLLQGYLWHPVELELDFADWLPSELDGDIHLIWDALPRAPFTFFDDGTPSDTQVVYQFTVLTYTTDEEEEHLAGILPWLAEQLQEKLDRTPAGVGWSLSEDLRPIG